MEDLSKSKSKSKSAIIEWIKDPHSSYFDFRSILSFGKIDHREQPEQKVERPTKDNSIAIVVTFNPDDSNLKSIEKLVLELKKIIIVDNSQENKCELMRERFRDYLNVEIMYNGNYNGLAGALNLGIRTLLTNTNNAWLFFFDQDSEIKFNFLKEVTKALKFESDEELWNSIYGVSYDGQFNKINFNDNCKNIKKVSAVITSGSFLRVESIQRIGLYIDELFIDSLDHEYCLRATRFGFEIKLITKSLMKHELGKLKKNYLPPNLELITYNHPPFRWFYFTRNLFLTGFDNLPISWFWIISHSFSLFKSFIKVLLFEKSKVKKAISCIEGFVFGVFLLFGKNFKK